VIEIAREFYGIRPSLPDRKEVRPSGACSGWLAHVALVCLILATAGIPQTSLAEEPSARDIMQRVRDRDTGDNQTSDLEMTLISRGGHRRVRELRSLRKHQGDDTLWMLFFLSPPDVRDTGFLTHDYDDPTRDDDQWLYLPALKKSKRIASNGKSSAFMGSDFSYADMTDRPLEHYDYSLLEPSEIAGHPVWVIDALPNRKEEIRQTGYSRVIHFIRQDNFVEIRAKIWLKKGRRNKYLEVTELLQIDGIWVASLMTMTTKKADRVEHKTILRTSNVQFNQPLEVDLFSVRGLEAGP
jgi:hypothetical protein